ncbi:MAG: GNAT family N-acetyltransferase [Acidimicrobiales bacterium]|nr:GNAT family N-acetyltransferase [Acidimicrobiales bacterium]
MARPPTTHTILADGTSVVVRPINPEDQDAFNRLVASIEPEMLPASFAARVGQVQQDEPSIQLDPNDGQFLVAGIAGVPPLLIGAALTDLQPDNPSRASFSVIVDPAHRGLGLATALVRLLAQSAHVSGVRSLEGDVDQENTAMLGVLTDVGLRVEQSDRERSVHATFDLEPTEAYLAAIDADEKAAACDALADFLNPERIAVVGASRDPLAIGGIVFANLIAGGFTGVVYPVNPSAPYVQGVAAYASLDKCPERPDLVVVCVPAPIVPGVIEEAATLGIRAVCIISAGFAEVGGDGIDSQNELLKTAQTAGMRIVGPNCMGLLNGGVDVRMNATFSRTFPRPGRLSFVSQSGALGLSVLDHLDRLDIGISGFVSVGNKSDVSGNDLLLYWEDDPNTDAILLYLESFGNPRRFSRIARRISLSKPIIAVKAGRTTAGRRAASSHTAALAAGDRAVDALFHQAGVIRTDTLEEMFAVASLVTTQPVPSGNRVAIMTNGGGPGILAADACESHGLSVVELSPATQDALRSILPPNAGISNPVDMIASSTAADYAQTLEILSNAPEVDAVIAIFIPPIVTDANQVASALADALDRIPETKPLIGVFMGDDSADPALARAGIPSFDFPEDAARALSALTQWAVWRTRPIGHVVHPEGIDPDRARQVVDRVMSQASSAGDEQVWLEAADADELLASFGIPLIRSAIVSTPDQAAEAFESLGAATVVVKIASSIHKKDVGGVQLGITSAAGAADAVRGIRQRLIAAGLAEHANDFIVQEMVSDGVEMMVGVTHDRLFGPLVVVGCGGSLVELIRDVNMRITPLTDVDVHEMLTTLRTYPLLTGFRGSEPLDVEAVKDLLYRVNSLVEAVPELAELDLNPVFAQPSGAVAVDLRVAIRAQANRLRT